MAKISPVSAPKVPGQSPTWCRRIVYLPPRSTHFPPVKRMQMRMHRKRQSTNLIPPIPKVPTLHLRLRFRPEDGRCCNELILVYIPHRSPPSQSKINRHRRAVGQQEQACDHKDILQSVIESTIKTAVGKGRGSLFHRWYRSFERTTDVCRRRRCVDLGSTHLLWWFV